MKLYQMEWGEELFCGNGAIYWILSSIECNIFSAKSMACVKAQLIRRYLLKIRLGLEWAGWQVIIIVYIPREDLQSNSMLQQTTKSHS